jgi:biopolymer transport protein ExbB
MEWALQMSPSPASRWKCRGLQWGGFLVCWLIGVSAAEAQNPQAWTGGNPLPVSSSSDRTPASRVVGSTGVRVARADPPLETSPVDAGPRLAPTQPATQPAETAGPGAAESAELEGASESAELIPTGSLLSVVSEGGVLMLPLLGCSFVLAAFGIERLVSLRTGSVIPRGFVEPFVEQLDAGEHDRDSALEVCEANGSPAAVVMAAAVRRWGRPAVEIEQAVIDAGERELGRLSRYRRVFHAIASTAPMLGLLGTVFGLIRSFNDVASAGAMGRPDLLAKGFGEALITTAMGLVVAIPAMVIHSWLTSRVEHLAMQLDEVAQHVVQSISLEASGRSGKSGGASRKQAA